MNKLEHRLTRIDKRLDELRRTLRRIESHLVAVTETVEGMDRVVRPGANEPRAIGESPIFQLLNR